MWGGRQWNLCVNCRVWGHIIHKSWKGCGWQHAATLYCAETCLMSLMGYPSCLSSNPIRPSPWLGRPDARPIFRSHVAQSDVKQTPLQIGTVGIRSQEKPGTGANSDPGKFAHGVISHLSKILRFPAFPQVPTHLQQQESLVFTGGRGLFLNHWNCAFQRIIFQKMWFEVAFKQKCFFLIFSGICLPSWPGLSAFQQRSIKSVSEVPRTCQQRST